MSELLDLAQAAVEAARTAGADFCDSYCSDTTEVSVDVERSSINYCATIRDQGISVRAYVNGGQGFATVQQLDLQSARECGRRAVEMAKAAHPDPDFVRLPDPTEAEEVPELFDERMAGLDSSAFVLRQRQLLCHHQSRWRHRHLLRAGHGAPDGRSRGRGHRGEGRARRAWPTRLPAGAHRPCASDPRPSRSMGADRLGHQCRGGRGYSAQSLVAGWMRGPADRVAPVDGARGAADPCGPQFGGLRRRGRCAAAACAD